MGRSKKIKAETKNILAKDTPKYTLGGFSAIDYEAKSPQDRGETTIVGISEYRKILADNISTDEQITKRLQYIEALCRNIIRSGIKIYVEGKKK